MGNRKDRGLRNSLDGINKPNCFSVHRKDLSDDDFSDDDEEESIDQAEELSPIKPAKKKQKS